MKYMLFDDILCLQAVIPDTRGVYLARLREDTKRKVRLIVKAAPWIQVTARAETAEHYDLPADGIAQSSIERYLTQARDYDAIEVSRVVTEINNDFRTMAESSEGNV